MVNDFLDNLGARQHRKMTEKNATKEEITNTCEETFGKKACHEETYYNSESEGKDFKDAFYAPENYGNLGNPNPGRNLNPNLSERNYRRKKCSHLNLFLFA